MGNDIRYQAKCYYATPEYSATTWGRYFWIYQGRGRLHLTHDVLRLEAQPGGVEIPMHAIKSVGLGRYSSAVKPGLNYLVVRYLQDGEAATIHLIPYESAFDPTGMTSELVVSWLETFRGIDVLAHRVEPAPPDADLPPSIGKVAVLGAAVAMFLLPALVALLIRLFKSSTMN